MAVQSIFAPALAAYHHVSAMDPDARPPRHITGVAGLLMTVAIVAAGERLGSSLAVAKGFAVLASFVVVYLVRRALMFSVPRKRSGRGDG